MFNGSVRRNSLSVIIIAKNEADRIGRCLASVERVADEIIVLDSGSSDETVNIAKKFTERVYEKDWPGYGKQKQRALDMAVSDWVLSLDADEELTEGLRAEIDNVLSGGAKFDGYEMRWAVMFLGKQMRFGANSRYVLRLFRREAAEFTDLDVHEKVMMKHDRTLGKLRSRLRHYSIRDFDHLMQKDMLYASLGAKQRFAKGRTGGGLVGATLRGIFVFLQLYIFRLGLLDGSRGYLLAVMHAQYAFNKYAGLWYLNKANHR